MTYIFDHIFKTAGLTFALSYLLAAFKKDEWFLINGQLEGNRLDLARLMALPEEEKHRWKVIAGHNAGTLRPHFPGARFITVVRDPVDRAISGYLHAKYHGDAWQPIGKEIQERNVGLKEFVETDLFARRHADFVSLHNWQAQVLLGPDFQAASTLDDAAVNAGIRARFYLVGYTGALELFIFMLHVCEGFPLVLFNNRNIRRERSSFSASPEEVAAIRRYNELDAVVYRCAKNEFDRRSSEVLTGRVVRQWDEYRDALERYRAETRGDENASAPFAPS